MGGHGSGRKKFEVLLQTVAGRRIVVGTYYLRGYSTEEIVTKTGIPSEEVKKHIEGFRLDLHSQEEKDAVFFRNKNRQRIDQAIKVAWGIIDVFEPKAKSSNRASFAQISLKALTVLIGLLRLIAEVEGVTTSKPSGETEENMRELLSKLRAVTKDAKDTENAGLGKKSAESNHTIEEDLNRLLEKGAARVEISQTTREERTSEAIPQHQDEPGDGEVDAGNGIYPIGSSGADSL